MTTPPSAPGSRTHFGFGAALAAHALLVEHRANEGWQPARMAPRQTGAVPMGSGAVQYGLSVFEGMKAFRGPDGKVHLFRPDRHAARMRASAERICLPPMPEQDFVAHVAAFTRAQEHLVPPHGQGALYLRPTLAAAEEFLGMRPATYHVFAILATPVPRPASKPIGLAIEREMVRAAPGGVGAAKTGGNYAASMLAAERAKAKGLDQVLWLDAFEHRYLEEAGVMNVFVALDGRVVTPPLDGTILPGVTRESCLALLRGLGVPVSEERIALDELVAAQQRGQLREILGTGTAACVVTIDRVLGGGIELRPTSTELAQRLRAALEPIQDGRAPDPHGWRVKVDAVRAPAGMAERSAEA
ncbi:MAG: branched-chain amino acid aminotransferase [Planctomycetes bacterium]|nr:branched-chain amino acid aminotransferase [Planctomycetota bacterium]